MLYFTRRTTLISGKEWDLKTITAGDYTVSMSISQEEYNAFLSTRNYDPFPVYSYMNYLKDIFENEISNYPKVNEETYDIKIANISFAFKNYKMIRLLEKRGSAITSRNIKKKEKIEKEISDLTQNNSAELSTPTYVFVTFETQEGFERAKRCKINGISFIPAAEPTNVLWENYRFTKCQKITRKLLMLLFISLLILFSFALFIFIKNSFDDKKKDYRNLNCNTYESEMKDNKMDDSHQLKYAMIDFYGHYSGTTKTKMTGALQCYCNAYCSKKGIFSCIKQEFSHEEVVVDGNVYKAQICRDYIENKYYYQFGGYFLSGSTVIKQILLKL